MGSAKKHAASLAQIPTAGWPASGFAVGDAQAGDEAAADAHTRQGGGECLASTVHHQQLVALAHQLGHLPRNRLQRGGILQQCSGEFDHHSHRC